jgi:hypothetical protein
MNSHNNNRDEGKESISPEDLDQIIDGWMEENPVSPDDPITEQGRVAVREISANLLGALIQFSRGLYFIISTLVNDLIDELSSSRESPERGFGWECLRHGVLLIGFGLLTTISYVVMNIFPGRPPQPILKSIIKWLHWGYLPAVITIYKTRHLLDKIQRAK